MERLWKELDALGACTSEAIERMMKNEALYLKCLKIFSGQAAETAMQEALEHRDYEELMFQAHTFKGTTGNLSLTPLYQRYQKLERDLRNRQYEGIGEQLRETLALQAEFCRVIDRADRLISGISA